MRNLDQEGYFNNFLGSVKEYEKNFSGYVEGAKEIDRGLRSVAAVWAIIWSIPFVRVMLIFGAIISIWKMVMRKRNE